jgi:long-chain acyl-CoA synthetase
MTTNIGSDAPGTLLTGGTGFLGGEVLARMLEREERPVYALVRAGSQEEADGRSRRMIEALLGRAEPWSKRVVAVAGDVTRPGLGIDRARREWLAARIDRIVHCAASVSFTLGLEESRQINVAGTRRMLDLGELCAQRGGLDSFVHVSTAYVAGSHPGHFGEHELDVGQEFRNAYERSKFEAEALVRERSASLPAQVVRPSIVVGDSRTGWTPAFNVLYAPIRAFAAGTFPVLPARRSSPVDVVPVDFVADAILALAGRPGTTHHLAAGDRASSVGELIDLASKAAGKPAPRVVPPRLYRRVIHPVLLRRGSERRRRALRKSEVFFPYFEMRGRFDVAASQASLEPRGIEPPPLDSYFGRLMDFARAAEWGKRPIARHEAARMEAELIRRPAPGATPSGGRSSRARPFATGRSGA